MNATHVPLELTKVEGFPDRRQGTISRHPSDGSEPILHLVTVVSQKRPGSRHTTHKVYVTIKGEPAYAGFVRTNGVGRWDIGVRNYGSPEQPRPFTDSGTLVRWAEYVAHGYLNTRDFHLKQKEAKA